MRRAIIVAAFMLFASQASAKALLCFFKSSGERFNLVTIDGADYIQWGSNKFEAVVSSFEDPYLTITQYGYSGTFNMVLDARRGIGYGGVVTFDGKGLEGDILCAAQ
jgi:predicted membrane-bound spermidine synthase